MKITIMRDQLIASLFTAAVKDLRYYLQGVYVEATAVETRLTSTDGHVLSTQRADAKDENDVEGVAQFILPIAIAATVKKDKLAPTVTIVRDEQGWALLDRDVRINFVPVDGQFPDYRRAIPAKVSGEPGQFNPELLVRFAKAAKALGAVGKGVPSVYVGHNGSGAALVGMGIEDYIGVIMPVRDPKPLSAAPAWAFGKAMK